MAYKPQGVVAKWLQQNYGGLFTYSTESVTVGVSSVLLLNNDPERVHLTIVNMSLNTVIVAPVQDVTLTNGIFLSGGGGSVTLNMREDLILPSLNWYAISDIAGSDVFVQSVRRYSDDDGRG